MTKQELVSKMQENSAWVPGKRVKIDFGDQGVAMLDGVGNQVTEQDGDAPRLSSWLNDFAALRLARLTPRRQG